MQTLRQGVYDADDYVTDRQVKLVNHRQFPASEFSVSLLIFHENERWVSYAHVVLLLSSMRKCSASLFMTIRKRLSEKCCGLHAEIMHLEIFEYNVQRLFNPLAEK